MEFWKLQNPCKTVTSGSGWEFNDIRFEFSSRLNYADFVVPESIAHIVHWPWYLASLEGSGSGGHHHHRSNQPGLKNFVFIFLPLYFLKIYQSSNNHTIPNANPSNWAHHNATIWNITNIQSIKSHSPKLKIYQSLILKIPLIPSLTNIRSLFVIVNDKLTWQLDIHITIIYLYY